MSITDTQILSYYYKGAAPLPSSEILISSVTAAEFLVVQSAKPNSANYYPILPGRLKHSIGGIFPGRFAVPRMLFDAKKHAALGRRRTDQLVLNFHKGVGFI